MESDIHKLKNEKSAKIDQKMISIFGFILNPRGVRYRNFFCGSSRTVSAVPDWKLELRVVMLRLRKSSLKAKKYVKMDFEQDFFSGSGQFFWPVCRTISGIMCKKNFTKIFPIFFSRMLQSQNFECRRNMDIFLPKQHPFLVFSSSNESQDRVLQD